KTTLLATLTGERQPAAGKLRRGHNITLGLLSQHADDLGETGTVLEAAQRATGLTPNKARPLLGRFLFSGEDAEKPLAGLPGRDRPPARRPTARRGPDRGPPVSPGTAAATVRRSSATSPRPRRRSRRSSRSSPTPVRGRLRSAPRRRPGATPKPASASTRSTP